MMAYRTRFFCKSSINLSHSLVYWRSDLFCLVSQILALSYELSLSWYEQKAVVILLTLLHLGIKGIHLDPSLSEVVSPAVLGRLNNSEN